MDLDEGIIHVIAQKIQFVELVISENRVDEESYTSAELALSEVKRFSCFVTQGRSIERVSFYVDVAERLLKLLDETKRENDGRSTLVCDSSLETGFSGGRPKFCISKDLLESLLGSGHARNTICKIVGISLSTLERRCREFGLRQKDFETISDDDLDIRIEEILRHAPGMGASMVWGALKSLGIGVARKRLREALVRAAVIGYTRQNHNRITRRKYNVSGPRALWHIDGNHKLIGYGFVIHAGIDGYSRLVIFAKVSTNNRAETMLSAFLEGVNRYGIPDRTRMDRGGENVLVAEWMVLTMGEGRKSFIAGPSVHNQRIERWWRDLTRVVSKWFKGLFIHMELTNLLDTGSCLDLVVLQFVYKPRIQKAIDVAVAAWNNHKMRTEHHKTPLQLFARGVLHGLAKGRNMGEDELSLYGVEVEGEWAKSCEPDSVILDDAHSKIPDLLRYLDQNYDPLQEDGNSGVNHFYDIKNAALLLFPRVLM